MLEGTVDPVDLPEEKKSINPRTGEPETYFRLRNSWGNAEGSNFGRFIVSRTELLSDEHLVSSDFVDVINYHEGDEDSRRRIGDLVTMALPALLVSFTVELPWIVALAANGLTVGSWPWPTTYNLLAVVAMFVRASAFGRALDPEVCGYMNVAVIRSVILREVNYAKAIGKAGVRDYQSESDFYIYLSAGVTDYLTDPEVPGEPEVPGKRIAKNVTPLLEKRLIAEAGAAPSAETQHTGFWRRFARLREMIVDMLFQVFKGGRLPGVDRPDTGEKS